MSLNEKQFRHTRKIALLIQYANEQGYELTWGDAYRAPTVTHGHPDSLHRKRLAVDLNLFKDGVFLQTTDDHALLGEFWEKIGGTWGGRFGDGNHYSLEHGGMK